MQRIFRVAEYVSVRMHVKWSLCTNLCKCKAIPLQALTSPEGSRRLRLQDFKTIGTWRWQGCQPYSPAAFTPCKYFWYSFLLEAESTPEPLCGRKDYVNEKFQWHHRESIPRLPVCSAVPQPLSHRVLHQLLSISYFICTIIVVTIILLTNVHTVTRLLRN
jgi:hypothetical protein